MPAFAYNLIQLFNISRNDVQHRAFNALFYCLCKKWGIYHQFKKTIKKQIMIEIKRLTITSRQLMTLQDQIIIISKTCASISLSIYIMYFMMKGKFTPCPNSLKSCFMLCCASSSHVVIGPSCENYIYVLKFDDLFLDYKIINCVIDGIYQQGFRGIFEG